MNKLFDELAETFNRLGIVYDELLETAKTKQQCLVSGNIEKLEMLLYQEKNQVEIAQLLEEKRQNILWRYCKKHHVTGINITMKSMMNKMDTSYREKISKQIDKLTHSIEQLHEVNQSNATLTHYSLEITEDIIKIFYPPAFQYPAYWYTGKIRKNELPMVLVDTEL